MFYGLVFVQLQKMHLLDKLLSLCLTPSWFQNDSTVTWTFYCRVQHAVHDINYWACFPFISLVPLIVFGRPRVRDNFSWHTFVSPSVPAPCQQKTLAIAQRHSRRPFPDTPARPPVPYSRSTPRYDEIEWGMIRYADKVWGMMMWTIWGIQTRAEEDAHSVFRVTCHQPLSLPISHLSTDRGFEKSRKIPSNWQISQSAFLDELIRQQWLQ